MSEDDKRLLDQYMNVLYRLTLAEYFFCVEAKDRKFTTDDKEYKALCDLIDTARKLYPVLVERKINPPIWGDKVVTYDKDKNVSQIKLC